MRVLAFTIGPPAEPSSRWRVHQYRPHLERLGIHVDVRSLAGPRYLELGYGLRRPAAPLRTAWAAAHFAARTARRVRDLLAARRYDALWIQKEGFPFGLERLIPVLGIPALYDLDDAVYLPTALADGRGPTVRRLADALVGRERALARLLPHCRAVLAGSPVLAEWARRHSANVVDLPTVVDTRIFRPQARRAGGPLVVGWIGAPPNTGYLEPLRPALRSLAQRFDLVLRLVGPHRFECPGVRVECEPWPGFLDPRDDARTVAAFDVSLMPLPATPFAAGKCAFKAIQSLACGVPVVASPVGANVDVVRDGETGLLARSPAEWERALGRLLADAGLRHRLGAAGRAHVQARYSLDAALPRLARAIECAATAPRAAARAAGSLPALP